MKKHDIKITGLKLYFLPVETRVPLKFGSEVLTTVTCARVCVEVENRDGTRAKGWGETPLSVQWVWPSNLSYETRETALKDFSMQIAQTLSEWNEYGHAFELGYEFQKQALPQLTKSFEQSSGLKLPYLAALVCFSLFDIALHDAYGQVNQVAIYDTYNKEYMNKDLSAYLTPAKNAPDYFSGKYPEDFLVRPETNNLVAWHLVGGEDLLYRHQSPKDGENDGYPYTLEDWIERDKLTCLKVKLRGNDLDWDYDRLLKVGQISLNTTIEWLTADFNCTVSECDYVNGILDRLLAEQPEIYKMILYIEQPFPYDLVANPIDVLSISARKPLFMDESAHDWEYVKLGRELGWTGVALKTCKTQTGALLSLCWAKAHGMTLMVQDLTNPMLAQIPHVLLAQHAGTIMGVETNGMQFYPEASNYEAKVHPGLYTRRDGKVSFETLSGNGFGYNVEAIDRPLPEPAVSYESLQLN